MMKSKRAVLIGFSCSTVCLGLLFGLYPWSVYFGDFTFSAESTFASYMLLAVLVGMVTAVVDYAVLGISRIPVYGRIALVGILLFLILIVLSLIFGPMGVEFSGSRVRGIFFSEWKFATFDCFVALPMSILNVVLAYRIIRREQKVG